MNQKKIMFKQITKKALEKFIKEADKHLDSWKFCPLAHLRYHMQQHISKWENNRFQLQKEKEIPDLLDIINYCVMIIERLDKN